MTTRLTIPSGSPLEPEIGFCRAARIGRHIAIAGTAPMDETGATVGLGDVYAQTRRCLAIIAEALAAAGATPADVIRTRVMLTDAETWRDAARAHGEMFADIRPVCTFVEVSRFIDPRWLVEVEADAILPEDHKE